MRRGEATLTSDQGIVHGKNMGTLKYSVLLVAISAIQPSWSKPPAAESRCISVECTAGSKVISYATPSDPYFACPTAELSDYTMMVMGAVSLSSLSGRTPNISRITGEPEFVGESAELLRQYRQAARVRTFDEAVSKCRPGVNGLRLVVSNIPGVGHSVSVSLEGKPGLPFWMSKAHLNLR